MRSCRLIPLLFAAVALAAIPMHSLQAAPAAAPAPAGTRIAIANPSRIFAEMKETKALRDKLELRRKDLANTEMQKRAEIETMIKDRDSNFNPKHPKYEEASANIDAAKAQFQAWGQTTKAQVEREQKKMVKTLYDKIETAVAQVAQQQGIDLVIADGRQDITNLEDVPAEELRRILNTRAVIYSTKAVDISELVIAVLDQQFIANGGAPAPAPAGGGGAALPPPIQSPTPASK